MKIPPENVRRKLGEVLELQSDRCGVETCVGRWCVMSIVSGQNIKMVGT